MLQVKNKINFNRDGILFSIIIFLFFSVGFLNQNFLTLESFIDVLNDSSILIILALGQMIVILIRSIDLSVASNLALTGMIVSLISQSNYELSIIFIIFMSIFIGTVLGLINGIFVGYLNVPFIIVTLGTLSIYRGLIYFISGGEQIYAHEFSKNFLDFVQYKFFNIPISIILALIIFVFFLIILNFTKFGKKIYALGDNPNAAIRLGINIKAYTLIVYAISGGIAGLCGYLWVAKYSVASSQIAIGFELTVISACVVGGISIMGGIGTVTGCLLGAFLIGLIKNLLPSIDVSQFWQLAISGIIILIAVIVNNKDKSIRKLKILKKNSK